jgi:hypothetical protein
MEELAWDHRGGTCREKLPQEEEAHEEEDEVVIMRPTVLWEMQLPLHSRGDG